MASINYHTREISCKIVYYGPGLSGKTTNLQIIHRKVPKENKSEMVSLATETDRTLFFDFLPLDLGSIKGFATKFQLYTVPGQVYYNATRKLVLRGVDGVVFVADSQRDKMSENLESLKNLDENLREYNIDLKTTPFVIQYNKRDLPSIFSVEEMNAQLNPYGVPCFEAQAHQGVGVFTTLKAIGKVVIDTFNAKYSSHQAMRRPESSMPSRMPPPPPPVPMAPPALKMPAAPVPAAPSPAVPGGFVPPAPPMARHMPAPVPAAAPVMPPVPPRAPAVMPPPPAPGAFSMPPAPSARPVPQRFPNFAPPPAPAVTSNPLQAAMMNGYGLEVPRSPVPVSLPPVPTTGFVAPAAVSPVLQAPGLQTNFYQSAAPSIPTAAPAPAPAAKLREPLDGEMDPQKLNAEIQRLKDEIQAEHAAVVPAPVPTPPAVSRPAPTPAAGADVDPNINPFLSPEEIQRFQQSSHDYPTQRLPMNPGNGQG